MNHRIYMRIDLEKWVCGTIDRHRHGLSWPQAWIATYRSLGGGSEASGTKSCPRRAAETIYRFGRLRNASVPCSDCDMSELWHRTGNRNGAYAMLAARLLCANPDLDRTALCREVREAVRREAGGKPARTDQGAATVTFKLWCLRLVEGGRE